MIFCTVALSLTVKPNVFDKAGPLGTRLLQEVLTKQKSQTEVAEILGCVPSNVSRIVNEIKDALDADVTIGSLPVTKYAQMLELEDINNKIIKQDDGTWLVNPISVIHHNIIRTDRMVMSTDDPLLAVAIMDKQVTWSDKLAKLQPPEEDKLNLSELYTHADMAIKFIPLLHDKINDQLDGTGIDIDVKALFLDYIKRVKGKAYAEEMESTLNE